MTEKDAELIGYVQPLVTHAGASVSLMASTEASAFDYDVVRIRHGDENSLGPGFKIELVPGLDQTEIPGGRQVSHLGSFARAPAMPLTEHPVRLAVEVWLLPTTPGDGRRQCVLSTLTPERTTGVELSLDPRGCLEVDMGGAHKAVVRCDAPLRAWCWHRIRTTFDLDRRQVELSVEVAPHLPATSQVRPPDVATGLVPAGVDPRGGALTIAASAAAELCGPLGVGDHLNGKVEAPAFWVTQRSHGQVECLATWDLGMNPGARVVEGSGLAAGPLEFLNGPTRGVTGSAWSGSQLRFSDAPDEYAAVHFHDDDLDDARWKPRAEIELPEHLESGVYAARLRVDGAQDHAPFIVSAGAGSQGQVVVVLPTLTYVAYANERMVDRFDYEAEGINEHFIRRVPLDDLLARRPDLGRSHYDLHSDGSVVTISTSRRAILNLRPEYRTWLQDAPRHLAADLYLLDWLDHQGIPYEVVTDHDLEDHGADCLTGFHVAITGSHPEYTSATMLDAYEGFLADGGHLIYPGGNGFYWVTSTHPTARHLAEVRRGFAGTRSADTAPGEGFHVQTGEPGGLWRHRGRAPNRLVGVGFTSQGWDLQAPGYRRSEASYDPSVSWVFDGIDDEIIGDFGLIMNGSAGDEIDRADPTLGTPPHAVVLASSTGHSDYYQLAVEEVCAMKPGLGGSTNELVRSDIVHFETDAGGAVFAIGSICFTGALSHHGYDNSVSRMLSNVLERFLLRSHGHHVQAAAGSSLSASSGGK